MIYAFFPILAAMCYGLAFAFTESALKLTNVATYMIVSLGVLLLTCFGLVYIKGEQPNYSFFKSPMDTAIVMIAVIAPALGWLLTTYAVKNVNASYAAFAEISYPLFTILFLFVFFGQRMFDWTTILGGLLIFSGSALLVIGQLSKS